MFGSGQYAVGQTVGPMPCGIAQMVEQIYYPKFYNGFVANKLHFFNIYRQVVGKQFYFFFVERVQMCVVWSFAIAVYAERVGNFFFVRC